MLTLTLLMMMGVFGAFASSNARDGRLLVANKGDHSLAILDPAIGRQTATIVESDITGHEVAASPDGKRAFVPIYGDSGVGLPGSDGRTLDIIELGERRIVHSIDFGRGVRPHSAVFSPKDGLLYVTTELDNSVTIVDPQTFKVVGAVPTGQTESHMLAISSDGRYAYTANVGPGTVSVLDLAKRKTMTVISVARRVQRISVSPNDRWAFTSDTESPRLAVINAKAQKVERWIELPSQGYGTASTFDGKWLLVAMPAANGIALVDLGTFRVAKTVRVPAAPQEILIRPDGRVAYVSCDKSHQVASINLSDWTVDLINAGSGADGLAWAR